jgi:hypothetical protein
VDGLTLNNRKISKLGRRNSVSKTRKSKQREKKKKKEEEIRWACPVDKPIRFVVFFFLGPYFFIIIFYFLFFNILFLKK